MVVFSKKYHIIPNFNLKAAVPSKNHIYIKAHAEENLLLFCFCWIDNSAQQHEINKAPLLETLICELVYV